MDTSETPRRQTIFFTTPMKPTMLRPSNFSVPAWKPLIEGIQNFGEKPSREAVHTALEKFCDLNTLLQTDFKESQLRAILISSLKEIPELAIERTTCHRQICPAHFGRYLTVI